MRFSSIILLIFIANISAEKINFETLNNYSEFLNFGEKKLLKLKKDDLENSIIKSKIDVLGEIFKKNVDNLKVHGKLDLIFLIDASSSVGENNFKNELKFVKKILSDVTVDYNHTRVAVVTFSSANNVITSIDEISQPKKENNKCLLLNKQLNNIAYSGGGTYTLGAFEAAKDIFSKSRNDSEKVLFLITDGYSNGGDPVPLAKELKKKQITIFTIGIQNGNYKELYEISSSPGEFYSYLLDSFQEFENLARRALHVDLKTGDYIPLGINSPCDILCKEGDCCDKNALCTCGTTTGHYSCICQPGFYGSGLQNSCLPCPPGTYSNGPNLCLPCPDLHHTTEAPANSIESCKCKTGYQSTEDNKCEILKCPKIATPEHGYFVKKRDCTNVLNSACGIRCEVGYTLVGTSIRLCQLNATWSGEDPSCQIKTCNKLPPPTYGTINCSHSDLGIVYNETENNFPVDTVCTFNCEQGKTLIGSSERTCLPLARWDGLKASCKQIKCPKLPQIKYGKIEPKSCTIGKQSYKTNCTITCNEGFEIEGPSQKVCTGNHGLWDSKFEDTICKDITPPTISCPKNITTSTLLGKKFGLVSWDQPEVVDNSDEEVSVWMKPAIKNITAYKFLIGTTKVTYFAQDAYHNRVKCSFYVMIEDVERPVIEDCESPPTFLTNEKGGSNISWDEPHIFDNSQNVKISKTHEFGFFPFGITSVTYTATDNSNNKNICILNITVEVARCEALADPIFGHSDCSSQNDGMQCVITCQEGYAVPLSQPQDSLEDLNSSVSFMCNESESIWYNQQGLMFPECSVSEVPKEIEQSGVVSIISESTNCSDTAKLTDLENDVKVNLQENSCGSGKNCDIKTNLNCEETATDDYEEKTNVIKRQATLDNTTTKTSRRRHPKKNRVNVKFQIRGSNITLNNMHYPNNQNITVQYHKPKIYCPLGFVPRKNRCVQCPKGTFHNTTKNKCQSCPFGYYNDKFGQTNCTSCPLHHSTRKMHSKRFENCKEQCPPGTHARKKIIKQSKHQSNGTIERATLKPFCRSCPIGFYQPNYGEIKCLPCPERYITISVGSVNINQCLATAQKICLTNICNGGECIVHSEFHYSCNCSNNYIGTHCEKELSPCDSNPCLNNGICNIFNKSAYCTCGKGFSGKYCQDVEDKCLLRCLNNGTCIQNDVNDYLCLCPKGFGGDTCEIKLTYCSDKLCDNNSTCIEEISGFRCSCSNGFIGRRCNILPCDYKPCKGNSICVNTMEENASRKSYSCLCPEGYTGDLCNEKIDFCLEKPCLNNGICVNNDNGFSCNCTKLFHGSKCEHKRRFNYTINFQKFSTTDYIKLNGFENNLTELTACLWMRTIDKFNYGTLLSYATIHFDNAFTLTDYTGLVLYVNNQYVVTDILLNDGQWHHVCASWMSSNGTYKIFIDGKLLRNGSNLATNMQIDGNGNMVLGQEQDILGGRFSQSESFIGQMAYVDVWSKVLLLEEITKHMSDCADKVYGNIYGWPEIEENVEGNIVIENTTFCNKCRDPRPIFNGFVGIVDNIAYYKCFKGYQISTTDYVKGRRCSKAAKWEGNHEPFCKKVYCGNPGFLKNGYMAGNKFFFHDRVSYYCYDGYKIIGNSFSACTENGNWSSPMPKCLGPQCSLFQKPENSMLSVLTEYSFEDNLENYSSFDTGTQIEIICDKDMRLVGEKLLTCLENGSWDHNPPKCILDKLDSSTSTTTSNSKLDCAVDKIPLPPDNGYIHLESLYAVGNGTNDTIEYRCRNGYQLLGDDFTTCIIDGYWTEPNISCDPILCVQPKFRNMRMREDSNNTAPIFGNMISFECIDGYRMFGDGTIRCLDNGKWSRMKAKCTKKSCRKPEVSKETIIEGNSYLFNDEIKLICPNKAQYTLKCNSSGVWDGFKDESC